MIRAMRVWAVMDGVAFFAKQQQRRSIASVLWFHEALKNDYRDPRKELKKTYPNSTEAAHLISIDDRYLLFRKHSLVVDFGSYPGSWSAVAAERCFSTPENPCVISVDKLRPDEIPGVSFLQGVVGSHTTFKSLQNILAQRKADIVLSDMTPLHVPTSRDGQQRQAALALIGAEIAEESFAYSCLVLCVNEHLLQKILAIGGAFICRGPSSGQDLTHLRTFLLSRFKKVHTHVTKFYQQCDLASDGAKTHLISQDRFLVALGFFGRAPIASEVQVQGHFDPREGRLGEMTTDLLDDHGEMTFDL